jgi:ABC-type transporter Mla maintaining outer membrane lipid asymmetry ATPase subunit MlaF
MDAAPPNPPPQIELLAVDVPRGDAVSKAPIIENVEWTLRASEFWVIGSRPGAGKTDLLCTAAGLLRPLGGRRLFFGHEATNLNNEEFVRQRLRIGMVFDGGRLFPEMTVAENIAMPVLYHRHCAVEEAQAAVRHALDLTGLEAHANQQPVQIVRGLHQRIGLARALALEPEVLLVDNPLGGIDPRQGRWWIEFLSALVAGHPKLPRSITIAIAVDDFRPWLESSCLFGIVQDRHFSLVGRRDQVVNSPLPLVRELLSKDSLDELA